jgi:predicted RNA-binding protein with PIN domain
VFLIDGYNVLRPLTRGRASADDRDWFIQLVDAWCRSGGYAARIVFDATTGMRPRDQRGAVDVRCVAQGRKADDEIIAAVSATSDRTAYTVVSSDGEIVREAGKRGMRVLGWEEFARMVLPPPSGGPEKPGEPTAGEVDYWLREFGIEE